MQEQTNYLPWIVGGCGCLVVLGLVAVGGGYFIFSRMNTEPEVRIAQTDEPRTEPTGEIPHLVSATVTAVQGNLSLRTGAICGFAIEPDRRDDGTIWCRSQVTCGSLILYGAGATNGYYNCTLSADPPRATGQDTGTTAQDSDPSFVYDTQTAQLTIRDDATGPHGAFQVTAHLNVVN